ncbi:MAG: hypothetical protein A3K19_02575 [Lentisphaerae bacterium RIFOXYB12_FULL_65_16]|nr:MAG: hypothetical protein A3K18_20770 [Lentisphaerae bacterium RIFOXYA12_64_32]OGV92970.1 MAG: hypothetical protein A3K19_02575 [Lentisphaerae bacterium RIFOXYB12_FULL_65_16]
MLCGDAIKGYEKYLFDESRRTGHATALAFPRDDAEVSGAVRAADKDGLSITVSGARTGIAAGAVPDGGMVISLERLNRICGVRKGENGEFHVLCQAGVSLADLQRSVALGKFADSATWDKATLAVLEEMKTQRLLYPPDPTETSAAIGGTVACNASGAHTFRYGPTRPYVSWIRVVLADGRVLELTRGQARADENGRFGFQHADGTVVTAQAPMYRWPATKNSGGYFSGAGMDLVDLFIGAEGTLGIITAAELRVVPAPEANCAAVTFWPMEAAALEFTRNLRQRKEVLGIEAIEYFGPDALRLLRKRRALLGAASGVPDCLPADAGCAIYLDIGTTTAALPDTLEAVAACVRECGGNPDVCWTGMTKAERERLRVFRHALPETVNAAIAEIRQTHPQVTKLGTDMAVPDECLERVVRLYRERLDAKGLDYVVFGHIGDNHLHINILPRNPAEYAAGKELYQSFARDVVAMGGSPAAEHGIGKLKTGFLKIMYGEDGVAQMLAVKRVFDPDLRLGKGTLFG